MVAGAGRRLPHDRRAISRLLQAPHRRGGRDGKRAACSSIMARRERSRPTPSHRGIRQRTADVPQRRPAAWAVDPGTRGSACVRAVERVPAGLFRPANSLRRRTRSGSAKGHGGPDHQCPLPCCALRLARRCARGVGVRAQAPAGRCGRSQAGAMAEHPRGAARRCGRSPIRLRRRNALPGADAVDRCPRSSAGLGRRASARWSDRRHTGCADRRLRAPQQTQRPPSRHACRCAAGAARVHGFAIRLSAGSVRFEPRHRDSACRDGARPSSGSRGSKGRRLRTGVSRRAGRMALGLAALGGSPVATVARMDASGPRRRPPPMMRADPEQAHRREQADTPRNGLYSADRL